NCVQVDSGSEVGVPPRCEGSSVPSTSVSNPVKDVDGSTQKPSLVAPTPSVADQVAALNNSLHQIKDWLEVVDKMLRQQPVTVGNVDEIAIQAEKQEQVVSLFRRSRGNRGVSGVQCQVSRAGSGRRVGLGRVESSRAAPRESLHIYCVAAGEMNGRIDSGRAVGWLASLEGLAWPTGPSLEPWPPN
ncbi:unnamed protein product, partial [Notodromas monacha]